MSRQHDSQRNISTGLQKYGAAILSSLLCKFPKLFILQNLNHTTVTLPNPDMNASFDRFYEFIKESKNAVQSSPDGCSLALTSESVS